MEATAFITNAHPAFIENLYKDYKTNPNSIDNDWKMFFDGFDFAIEANKTEIDENGSAVSSNGVKSAPVDFFYCKSEHFLDVKFYLNEDVKQAFDKELVGIPYPTMDLNIVNVK